MPSSFHPAMDKHGIIMKLLEAFRAQLDVAAKASSDAAEYAINEESRAESKWDTQGIEASYLAAGQADNARALAETVKSFQVFLRNANKPASFAAAGALVKCNSGSNSDWYFISPEGGGTEVDADGTSVTVITPQSPLGKALIGKSEGSDYTLNQSAGIIERIL